LGDLIFGSAVLKKARNNWLYCEFFLKQQARKAKDQNLHFERPRVYTPELSKCYFWSFAFSAHGLKKDSP
jgi:hypothetical protein